MKNRARKILPPHLQAKSFEILPPHMKRRTVLASIQSGGQYPWFLNGIYLWYMADLLGVSDDEVADHLFIFGFKYVSMSKLVEEDLALIWATWSTGKIHRRLLAEKLQAKITGPNNVLDIRSIAS